MLYIKKQAKAEYFPRKTFLIIFLFVISFIFPSKTKFFVKD